MLSVACVVLFTLLFKEKKNLRQGRLTTISVRFCEIIKVIKARCSLDMLFKFKNIHGKKLFRLQKKTGKKTLTEFSRKKKNEKKIFKKKYNLVRKWLSRD